MKRQDIDSLITAALELVHTPAKLDTVTKRCFAAIVVTRRADGVAVDPIHELETNPDLLRAARGAYERVRSGLVVTLRGDGMADMDWAEGPGPDTVPCFARIKSGYRKGELCGRYAGAGTDHEGVGRCRQHGGSTEDGIREAAWVVGHAFARALEVTPWEGLLTAVKIAAGRVAFCEAKLATATEDRQLEPPNETAISEAGRTHDAQGTNLNHWVKQAELWHDKLARVSKLAIDAGVAERLVRQLELEAQLMLRATSLTLAELGLSDEVQQHALGIMSRNLLALEAEEVSEVRSESG